MLQIENLHFAYPSGNYGLTVDHFQAKNGESIAIVGPSGCGKTSFLNLIACLLTPKNGTIALENKNLLSLPKAERSHFRLTSIGLIFQEFALIEHLTVKQNILLPLNLSKRTKEQSQQITHQAKELAEETGLSEHWNRLPQKLSQGERQRVALCRALAIEPQLLLADEPTGNLDPENKQKALQLLLESTRRRNIPLLVATHDLELLDAFDRTVSFDQINTFAAHQA